MGQQSAKRAVAVALRNRWRKKQVPDADLQRDITPKNILMIGPTGVGKSEIARRMARITDAPYVKVEATKYTEVGIKGKDVDSIIEDLFANALTKARRHLEREKDAEAQAMALETVFSSLVRNVGQFAGLTMDAFVAKLKEDGGAAVAFKDVSVPIRVTQGLQDGGGGMMGGRGRGGGKEGGGGMGGIVFTIGGGDAMDMFGPKVVTVTVPVADAIPQAKAEALHKIIPEASVVVKAKQLCESDGIVVIDEIDKIVVDPTIANKSGGSDEAVQQDLLPIVEGSTITMKDGQTQIDTSGILFICCGAFHSVKPSDMIAELQGRLPVRVELASMTAVELKRILTEPKYNILAQQQALLAVDNIRVVFDPSGIHELAEVAAKVNATGQNTGARRLSTVVERVMDDVSFDVEKYKGADIVHIDDAFVKRTTADMVTNIDLGKYLL